MPVLEAGEQLATGGLGVARFFFGDVCDMSQ